MAIITQNEQSKVSSTKKLLNCPLLVLILSEFQTDLVVFFKVLINSYALLLEKNNKCS